MADKKITDLTLIDSLDGAESFPVDDSIQTYRATATQMKNFVLPDGGLELAKLSSTLINYLTPTGVIQAYVGTSAPTGWLLCDGSQVSRETYSDLFAVIGESFGQGDNSTTFHLPDLRGQFLRGRANGSANDPDRASRTAAATGGNTGDNVGSVQNDAFQNITGTLSGNASSSGGYFQSGTGAFSMGTSASNRLEDGSPAAGRYRTFNFDASNSSGARTSTETRPKNTYVNFIIKI